MALHKGACKLWHCGVMLGNFDSLPMAEGSPKLTSVEIGGRLMFSDTALAQTCLSFGTLDNLWPPKLVFDARWLLRKHRTMLSKTKMHRLLLAFVCYDVVGYFVCYDVVGYCAVNIFDLIDIACLQHTYFNLLTSSYLLQLTYFDILSSTYLLQYT